MKNRYLLILRLLWYPFVATWIWSIVAARVIFSGNSRFLTYGSAIGLRYLALWFFMLLVLLCWTTLALKWRLRHRQYPLRVFDYIQFAIAVALFGCSFLL